MSHYEEGRGWIASREGSEASGYKLVVLPQSATSTRPVNSSRDGDSTTSLGSLFQCLITLSVKKFLIISNLNLPWHNLTPSPLLLGRRDRPHLSTTSFQVVVESDEVSPQPPFLQAEQPQVPQPLLIRLLLQTLHQLCCPSLDTLQPLNVLLVLRDLKLNTAFEVWPHQCQLEDMTMNFRAFITKSQNRIDWKRPLKIIESNCKHYTTSLSTSSKRPLNTSRDGDSTTSLGSLFQCLTTLSVKKNFLISIVESDEVSPQPPFLQAEQPQVPQPFPISLVLQTLPQLRCPSLDTLQPLNVSLGVGGPTLNTAFEVRPHQCRVQGHNHCPSPAGHAIFDTSQDAIGFLGHLGTLLAHIQAAVNQHPQVLLCQAAFQPLFPKPVALHGVVGTQVQDPALSLVEPHTIDLGPSIQPVQVPLQSLPTLK
ncbi:hypothetical protein QYF61_009461 [Mycteria americana]|uniref:Uncharacterized protein n=1 Tax=Mycteria americana TaxID=33587 RepID=A0AAN7N7N9_MYCAM|nr:hypothetical protein QYF61_009461 [Mycteria americana]